MKKFTSRIFSGLLLLFTHSLHAQNVWTQHNDQGRTGWYPYESTLNIENVNQNTFGFYFSHTTDDKVVSQPLVVMNVNIPGKGIKNIVIVTTLNNSVYAYDADVNANPYWQQNFTNKVAQAPGADCIGCRPAKNTDIHPSLCGGVYGDFSGNMGIVGTPVIDTLAGTMYFVTKIVNPNDGAIDNHGYINNIKDEYNYTITGFHQYLHAIDISTGNERSNSPVEIKPTINGTGDGQTSPGTITFNPRTQFNRAGLVLSNGMVYIAFASHCDFNPSHGWIVSYDASTLNQLHAFITTPNDGRGGIWMSGTAPAVDGSGNIYFTNGNALDEGIISLNYNTYTSPASDVSNRGEGVVKLAPDLTLSSYFTPYNYIALNEADKDFPTQVMLLPNTNLAITGCKDGNLYVLNRNNMGGYNSTSNQIVQQLFIQNGATMHSSFAYFGGTNPQAYQFSENSPLRSYKVSSSGLGTATTNTTIAGPSGGTGGFLSVSSNGTDQTTGIIWAYRPIQGCNANNNNCHAILHAVNASDITNELWNSDMVTADNVSVFNKFSCPTIARGKVFIAANTNQLYCFGLKTNTTCVTDVALDKTATVLSHAGGFPASNATDGVLTTSWRSLAHLVDSVYVDLGSEFDMCRIAFTWENNRAGQDFDVKVSDDGIKWTIVNSIRGNALTYNEINSNVTGRYVSMVGLKPANSGNGYGLFEFQAFGQPASACNTPLNLSASSLTSSSEHISWDAVSGAGQYIVKYRHYLSQEWLTKNVTGNSIDLKSLNCGSLYYYTVQATCSSASSTVGNGSFTPAGCAQNNCDIFPVRYYNIDLGDIGVAGSTCKQENIYTVTGSGTDIGGGSDQFQFAYTNNNTGDYEASAKLIQQDQLNTLNKAGIMARDSLTGTSRFAFVYSINNGNSFIFEYRNQAGGPVTTITLPGHFTLPYYLKIKKIGTQYSGFVSSDDISWVQVGSTVDLGFGNNPANIPNYGMAVTSVNNNSLSSAQFQDFSFVGVSSQPLPVVLLNFSAKNINNSQVSISWATSMEHLSDYFEVQRSFDGNQFTTITKVNATGESQIPHYYTVNDSTPQTGINLYRLKENDKDGKFYISPTVSVKLNETNRLEVYPNPAADYTNVSSTRYPILDVEIYDATGKLIQRIHPAVSRTTIHLDTGNMPKGIYFITVNTTESVFRQKLFKD